MFFFFFTLCKLCNPLLPSGSQDWVFKVIIDVLGPHKIFINISIRDVRISEIERAQVQVTSKIYWPTHIFNLPTHIFSLPSLILANIATFLIV